MNANDIRLYEHIRLLQRGVELFQQQVGKSCDGLRNGFNDQKIRIGLMGATSSGKTTLIKRLLAGAAGKISSRPETACLVIHDFSRAESLSLTLNDAPVLFSDERTSRAFGDFLKEFHLRDRYRAVGGLKWVLQVEEREVLLMFPAEKNVEFFEQVNKFGEAFVQIKWNHRRHGKDYNLTDLFVVYDLPGFGGREEHDKAVERIIDSEKFDVLVYLIDTDRGIPGSDEIPYLLKVQSYLENNKETAFYWAYEKVSQSPIPLDEKKLEIEQAMEAGGCSSLVYRNCGLLDLTGPEEEDCENLRSKILRGILRPYFSGWGNSFAASSCSAFGGQEKDVSPEMIRAFEVEDSWSLIGDALTEIDRSGESDGSLCTCQEARRILIRHFLGSQYLKEYDAARQRDGRIGERLRRFCRSFWNRCVSSRPPTRERSDCERAEERMRHRIFLLLNEMVKQISDKPKGKETPRSVVNRTKVRKFKEIFLRNEDFRLMLYDIQYHWMLNNPKGVVGFIKRPMVVSLCENIMNEVQAIGDFVAEEEE